MFILIIVGALGTVTKGLIKGLEDLEIRGPVETIQTTALLRSARILRRVLEETCCRLNSSERPSADADVKNSQGVIMLICVYTISLYDQILITCTIPCESPFLPVMPSLSRSIYCIHLLYGLISKVKFSLYQKIKIWFRS